MIGGGPAGENIAQYTIESTNLTAVPIEGKLLSGEYFYYAYIPNKASFVPIEIAMTSANLGDLHPTELSVLDLPGRRDEWVSRYDDAG